MKMYIEYGLDGYYTKEEIEEEFVNLVREQLNFTASNFRLISTGIDYEQQLAKQAEIIAVMKACIYSIKTVTSDGLVKELISEYGGDLMQIEAKYKGKE